MSLGHVIILVVIVFMGARAWTRMERALLDIRSAKAGLELRRRQMWNAVVTLAVVAVAIWIWYATSRGG